VNKKLGVKIAETKYKQRLECKDGLKAQETPVLRDFRRIV